MKLKCHRNQNVKRHHNLNVTKTEIKKKGKKTEMSTKLKWQQNWNGTKPEMSHKLKCQQTTMSHKTEISLKLKCHQN